MPKYEHRIIDHDWSDVEEHYAVNSMGKRGWEVVAALGPIKYSESDGYYMRVFYKREISEPCNTPTLGQ